MSAPSLLLDGALRAAQLVPLLFAIHAAPPAQAQLPRPAAATAADRSQPATVVLDDAGSSAPLSLRASHVDIRVTGGRANVRTTLTYRNDGALPVDALYTVPLPGELATLRELDDPDAGCADGDLHADLAQFLEAGEALPPATSYERGSVRVAPGEEITVRLDRATDLVARGDRRRLVLPLPTQRGGAFAPPFSAEVVIQADRPVHDLASATHPAEISGLGSRQARLSVTGRAYEGQFLAFDYALGNPAAAEEPDAPVARPAAWGGEARTRHDSIDLAAR